jgi:hypothetical protein
MITPLVGGSSGDITAVVAQALSLSYWSFIVFATLTLLAAIAGLRRPVVAAPPAGEMGTEGVPDPGPIADALAKLISALNGAGPPLLAILASLSFMLIAAIYAPKSAPDPIKPSGASTPKEGQAKQPQ